MATPVAVKAIEAKSFASPDEVRTPSKTRVEVNHIQGFTLGRFHLDPGWRWSECIKPVAKTDTCQISHVGCAISGRLTVQLQDGTKKTISAGECYAIPPGHEAWVEGNEKFVAIEVLSAEQYAKG